MFRNRTGFVVILIGSNENFLGISNLGRHFYLPTSRHDALISVSYNTSRALCNKHFAWFLVAIRDFSWERQHAVDMKWDVGLSWRRKFPYETVSLWAICKAFPKYLNNLIRSEMLLNEGIFSRIINVLALPLFGAYSNAIIVDFYSQMKRLRLRIFSGERSSVTCVILYFFINYVVIIWR